MQKMYKISVLTEGFNLKNVKLKVNESQLHSMNISCAEHAIISICTAFETYYKALIQQILSLFPGYLIARGVLQEEAINKIIHSKKIIDEDNISKYLNLNDRNKYFKLLLKMELFNKE